MKSMPAPIHLENFEPTSINLCAAKPQESSAALEMNEKRSEDEIVVENEAKGRKPGIVCPKRQQHRRFKLQNDETLWYSWR